LSDGESNQETRGAVGAYGTLLRPYYVINNLGERKKLRQITIKLANLLPGDKVLEIGCGTGTLTLAAKAQVGTLGEVVGLDMQLYDIPYA
jgi:ubiquinone/menaquinone biosynthesis C-methylase UbiE